MSSSHCLPAPPLLAAVIEVLSARAFLIQASASLAGALVLYTTVGYLVSSWFPRKVSVGSLSLP